ncbi:MAG: hypothetical protein UHK60_04610 [Acutalibacteraceae bacterium]|nr:hypothetical protein [Acutalibacteraceae bacterium]
MGIVFNQIFSNIINITECSIIHKPSLSSIITLAIFVIWFFVAKFLSPKLQYIVASLPVISSIILFFFVIESWKFIIVVAALSIILFWVIKNHSWISFLFENRSFDVETVPDYMFVCGILVTSVELPLLIIKMILI